MNLLHNSRFYILMTSIIASILVASWLRLIIPGDQLYVIRLQQFFGLAAIVYWYIALIISPVGYIIGKQRIKQLEFARRAIGVSAAYFAVLHGSVALWGQLGGPLDLALLPDVFKWSLAGGAFGVVVLLIMALTSFDKVVAFMTFKRWKLLHRLTYIAWVAVALHIWTIGTHLAYSGVQWAVFMALITLLGLELFRSVRHSNERYLHLARAEWVTIFVSVWVLLATVIAMVPFFVHNYHGQHVDHDNSGTSQHKGSHHD